MKYLRFEEVDSQGRKTRIWHVIAVRSDVLLASIKWYASWREYAFWPEPRTTFNPECLNEISRFCADKTVEHRAARAT